MKMNWTPEPAHRHRPDSPHAKLAWALWITGAVLLAVWIAAMALGAQMGGRADLLLLAFAALLLVCVLMGFRNVEYLEPMQIARRRIMRMRAWRWARRRQGE
jgi:hypothetical protein